MLTHRLLTTKLPFLKPSYRLLSATHHINQQLAKKPLQKAPLATATQQERGELGLTGGPNKSPESFQPPEIEKPEFNDVGVTRAKEHLNNYMALAKNRLSYFVVFTANAGYCIATDPAVTNFDYTQFWLGLTLGTYLCSASANSFNQIFEVPYDSQMTRTQTRPLVKGAISPGHATAFAGLAGITGSALLYSFCNLPTALLGAGNILLYAGAYTSMKRRTPMNTKVGAIVGAIPPLMGATSTLGWAGLVHPGALSLSAILFFWQFPHFYALAHNRRHDYLRAGYKMLPQINPKSAQRWSFGSALALWPMCLGSYHMEYTGHVFLVASTIANVLLTGASYPFYKNMKNKEATRLFRISLVYILMISAFIGIDVAYKRYEYYSRDSCPSTMIKGYLGMEIDEEENSVNNKGNEES
jgi:protoheme IX farnesyltransferase